MAKKIKEKKIPRFAAISDLHKYYTAKEFIRMGEVKKEFNYFTHAGMKVELSKKWFPIFIYINQFLLSLSLITTLLILLFLSGGESPTVFANFKNGKLMCTNEAISLKTEKPIGRESPKYQKLCEELNDFNTDKES
jgi:hypothetical protein